jgi:N-hydroxyarylamine O-acetyltransferase
MSKLDIEPYLARIGYSGPKTATLTTLHELHALHPAAIAFENLDVLLKRPICLDADSLVTKLVEDKRGGYCYEQNTLFQVVLRTMGFSVGSIAARVQWRYPEGSLTPRYHMLLRIHLSDGDYIADVGFGLYTLTAPLRLETGIEQPTPHGIYRLVAVRDEIRMEVKTAEGWSAVYQISLQEQASADWEVANWYTSTCPASRFTKELMAARPTGKRRYGLLNNVLSIHNEDGTTDRQAIQTPEALEMVLRNSFNINVPVECKGVFAAAMSAVAPKAEVKSG